MEPEEGTAKVSVYFVQIESWGQVIILFTLGFAVWALKSLAHPKGQQCVCVCFLRSIFKVGCLLWRQHDFGSVLPL